MSDAINSSNWKSVPGFGGAVVVLLAFLAVDTALIVFHLWLSLNDALEPLWRVYSDGSIPEMWQYFKWLLLIAFSAIAFWRDPSGPYLVLILLFSYLLIDDSIQVHESAGRRFVDLLGFVPALGLRAVDFGELTTTAIASFVIFGLLFISYRHARSESARRFTRRISALVIALAFFGVGVDMLDIIVTEPTIKWALVITEDSGEMIVASVIVACGYQHLQSLGYLQARPAAAFPPGSQRNA